ncbi:MAG: ECF-type sigma factor [Pseudomonadota bacterium]|nr:ECF-type sigma factor [Pseudomonadota bacterium]
MTSSPIITSAPTMTPTTAPDITELLNRWRSGQAGAQAELMREVYPILRDMARARLRRSPDGLTLQATEIAHEAYLRIAQMAAIEWNGRVHFFAVAANAIRNIVIDHLRARNSEKRGGDLPFVPLHLAHDEAPDGNIDLRVDWLAVHAALNELEATDARSARIVELKFFSGLTTDEIAQAMALSSASVVREWRFGRAWLANRLGA